VSVEVARLELDLTVKLATPLLVFCGEEVRSVVELPAVRLKLTENVPAVARFLLASTMLTVPIEVDEPSDTM
jgi:hypothetical protein